MSKIKLEWFNREQNDPFKRFPCYGGIVIYDNKLKKLIYCEPKFTYFRATKDGIQTDLHYSSYTENYVKDFDLWASFPIHKCISELVTSPFDILYDLNRDYNSYFSLLPLDVIKKIISEITN